MPTVRRCRPDERGRAVETVVAAFASDPLLRWVWPDQARYDACAPAFFGLLVDLRLAGGEVWTADGGDAVAMWDPPGGLYVPAPEGAWADVQSAFTEVERARWQAFDSTMEVPAAARPYWFLGVLATTPGRWGQGLGRSVLAPVLGSADRAGLPTFLETASTTNVAFYRGCGFEVVREASLPGGPCCWLLRREPS